MALLLKRGVSPAPAPSGRVSFTGRRAERESSIAITTTVEEVEGGELCAEQPSESGRRGSSWAHSLFGAIGREHGESLRVGLAQGMAQHGQSTREGLVDGMAQHGKSTREGMMFIAGALVFAALIISRR